MLGLTLAIRQPAQLRMNFSNHMVTHLVYSPQEQNTFNEGKHILVIMTLCHLLVCQRKHEKATKTQSRTTQI